jgi:hypothetical protein
MERNSSERIRWKKIGGGSLTLLGKFIKPNDIFTAYPHQIPKQFRDVIIPLDEIREQSVPKVEPIKTTYKVVPRGASKSMFDVVNEAVTNEEGIPKRINDKPLTKEVAEQLIQDLAK